MANVFRKIANARALKNQRSKESEISDFEKNSAVNKERDKLLNEFLTARDELKEQYDYEKREIVTNYERRLKYLRRLVEEYDENMNMLKLNLDAEREENYILKTKVYEFENKAKKQKTQCDFNKSYEEESTLTYDRDSIIDNITEVEKKTTSASSTCTSLEYTQSAIDGLKYSSRYPSIDSIAKSSFTSVTMDTTTSDITSMSCFKLHVDDDGLHQNCRQEFNRLLEELRLQKKRFDEQLSDERETMREQMENEKLQLERIVFKQLNIKLDKEIKKHELLHTENNHLRQTITQTALESLMDHTCHNKQSTVSEESNSDSGADVEYFRSDDESDTSSCKSVVDEGNTKTLKTYQQQDDSTVSASLICSILHEQKVRLLNDFQKQMSREQRKARKLIEELNQEIVLLVKENRALKQEANNYEGVTEFHYELTQKLNMLQGILVNDPDAC